jgi:hypothetical protein
VSDRPFVKLYTALLDHDKWVGLDWPTRSAWYGLQHLCGRTHGQFRSESHAVALLRREGHPDPATAVTRLIEAHLLDEADGGELTMHDWPDWQPEWRHPSDLPAATAARKRAQRARDVTSVTSSHDESRPDPSGSRVGHDSSRQEGERERERDTGASAPVAPARARARLAPTDLTDAERVTGPLVMDWLRANEYALPAGWAMGTFVELVAKVPAGRLIATLDAGKVAGAVTTRALANYVEQALAPGRPQSRNGHRPGAVKPGEFTMSQEEAERAGTRV